MLALNTSTFEQAEGFIHIELYQYWYQYQLLHVQHYPENCQRQ